MSWPWEALGLDGPSGLPEVRRAYAALLKTTHPEDDPEGFQRLHSAYQSACRMVRRGGGAPVEPPAVPERLSVSGAVPEAEPRPASDAVPETDPVPAFSVPEAPEPDAPPDSGQPGQNWDFDRLFSEAEAERRAAMVSAWRVRVGKAAALIGRSRRPFQRTKDAKSPARVTALQALYLLEDPDPAGGWALNCQVLLSHESFRAVRDDPLFLACLTRFFRERPELPPEVRSAFFRAYGFHRKRMIPLKYWPLFRQLASERERRAFRSLAGGLAVMFAVCSLAILSLLFFSADVLERVSIRRWLEEDFGGAFHIVLRTPGILDRQFYPDGEPDLRFQAVRYGTRSRTLGSRGYWTDYTAVRLGRELSAFADARGLAFSLDRSRASPYQPAEAYLYLPLTGAGADLTALADLLTALEQEDWYRELPPEYLLYLCWQDWCFYPHASSDGALDGASVREYYENGLGPAMCTVLAEESGAAASDMGADAYLLTEQGTVQADGEPYFATLGTGKASGEPLALYLLSSDGGSLFCLPPDAGDLTRPALYAKEPDVREVTGVSGGLAVRDYVWDGPG